MLNYDEIVTRSAAHCDLLLTNAEQQRLAQSLTTAQPHSVIAWVGQQLIKWGRQWQSDKQMPVLPAQPSHFSNRRQLRHGSTLLPLLALLTCWFCLSTRPAAAANIRVNGTTCTLVNAIHAANNDTASGGCPAGSGADTITLLTDVMLSSVDNDAGGNGATGLPAIRSVITVTGGGHIIGRTAGSPAFRLLYVVASGTLTLNRLTLTGGNTATDGGGILTFGTLTVSNSTLSGNTATYFGGGIYNYLGTLMVSNSTLSGNTAARGGGIYNDEGTLMVSNSTLSGNTADYGGGIYNYGTLTLNRSLLAGNHGNGSEVYFEGGTVNANNDSLFGVNGNAGIFGFTPGPNDIVPSVGLAQILNSTLTDNGGGTPTHALVSGSPAIDAAGDSGLNTDQRGILRPQGIADDIGAFELEQPPATIRIVLNVQPKAVTNFGFSGDLGSFRLDDPTVDDGDAYTNTRTFRVPAGNYTVSETPPSGWYVDSVACGTALSYTTRQANLSMASGDTITCTFTNKRTATLTMIAFNDLNGNGVKNASEPTQEGWTMQLGATGVPTLTQVTASITGRAVFKNLRPGLYRLCEAPQPFWLITRPTPTTAGYPCYQNVTLTGGVGVVYYFGNHALGVGMAAAETEAVLGTDDGPILSYDLPATDDDGKEIDDALPLLFLDAESPIEPALPNASDQQAFSAFLTVAVVGRDSALAESVPVPQEILHLDADANSGDAESADAIALPPTQAESQNDAGQSLVLDSPLGVTPTVRADEEGALPTHTLFLPLVTQ